ncbi:VOC family protein [Paenibacillus sp. HJGM_3]|uniref:VOC family protein n=1 Tax=Paenibacillus sp. HJGM_3 TaxID=3379816 RepID=UPI00385EBB3F
MPDQTMITGITAIFIPVPDVEKAKDWYEKYLELKWNGFCFVVPSGPPIFLTESKDRWELQALSFKVTDAHELHKKLETHGIRVQAIREIPGIGKEFDFYDPFGNKLQATQPSF